MSEVSFSCFSDSDENGNGPVAQSSSSSAESSSGSETDSEDDSDSDNIAAQKKKKSEAKSKPKVSVWFLSFSFLLLFRTLSDDASEYLSVWLAADFLFSNTYLNELFFQFQHVIIHHDEHLFILSEWKILNISLIKNNRFSGLCSCNCFNGWCY